MVKTSKHPTWEREHQPNIDEDNPSTWWGPLGRGRWEKPWVTGNEAILAAVTEFVLLPVCRRPILSVSRFGLVRCPFLVSDFIADFMVFGIFSLGCGQLYLNQNQIPNHMQELLPEWSFQNKTLRHNHTCWSLVWCIEGADWMFNVHNCWWYGWRLKFPNQHNYNTHNIEVHWRHWKEGKLYMGFWGWI